MQLLFRPEWDEKYDEEERRVLRLHNDTVSTEQVI
jgi:hypothetical protein